VSRPRSGQPGLSESGTAPQPIDQARQSALHPGAPLRSQAATESAPPVAVPKYSTGRKVLRSVSPLDSPPKSRQINGRPSL